MSKGNLYIFERKELVILLILLVLVAILAFTLGVKLGRDLQLPPDGKMALLSEGNSQSSHPSSEPLMEGDPLVESKPVMKNNKHSTADKWKTAGKAMEAENTAAQNRVELEKMENLALTEKNMEKHQTGPPPVFTLQVGSHRTFDEASKQKKYITRHGFPAQVLQVDIPRRGTWYRVSIGAFDDKTTAVQYGKKLKSKLPQVAYILQTL